MFHNIYEIEHKKFSIFFSCFMHFLIPRWYKSPTNIFIIRCASNNAKLHKKKQRKKERSLVHTVDSLVGAMRNVRRKVLIVRWIGRSILQLQIKLTMTHLSYLLQSKHWCDSLLRSILRLKIWSFRIRIPRMLTRTDSHNNRIKCLFEKYEPFLKQKTKQLKN